VTEGPRRNAMNRILVNSHGVGRVNSSMILERVSLP
jgi:hypothetical protein